MSPPFVSIIIPVYNDTARLRLCLQSLEKQSYPPESYEVIVVDNGSDHPIDDVISDFTHARSVYEPRHGSYQARNRGIALSKGGILAFTDSDCVPSSNWIENGARSLSNNPGVDIVGGKISFLFRDPQNPTVIELYDSMVHLRNKEYIEKENFSVTANMFVHKKAMDQTGGFDDSLKSSGDKEWGNRAALSGYKLLYADDVIVSHPARHSFIQLREKSIRIMAGTKTLRENQPLSKKRGSWGLLPPLITLIRLGLSNKIPAMDLMKVILIAFALQYYKIKEYFGFTTNTNGHK